MSAAAEPPIGLVGLGRIGEAVTVRLIAAGRQVLGFRRGPTDVFAALGGTPGGSVAEIAERCETIFLALPDSDASRTVIEAAVASANGAKTFIDLSAMSPQAAIALAHTAREAGHLHLEAPVSGTAAAIRDGGGTIFVGGEPDEVARALGLLELVAPRVLLVGGVGSASALKSAALMMMAVNTVGVAEALAYLDGFGADLGAAVAALAGGPGSSAALAHRGPLMASGNYAARFGRLADLRAMLGRIADGAAAPTAMLHQALAAMDGAIGNGRGDADFAAAFEELRARPVQMPGGDGSHRG